MRTLMSWCFAPLSRIIFPETVFGSTFKKHMLIFCGCLYLLVLPILLHNQPQSVYYPLFNSNVTAETRVNLENEKRIFEASLTLDKLGDKYLKLVNHTEWDHPLEKPRISIVVATVSRNIAVKSGNYSPKYLTQVTAKFISLISELGDDYPFHVDFCICNMDPRPKAHPEAEFLAKFAPLHTKPPQKGEWAWHLEQRLKEGYVYCLNHSASTVKGHNADFVFIIEDDAIPNDDLFSVIKTMIYRNMYRASRKNRLGIYLDHTASSHSSDSTVFIKFYHPDRLLGFIALDRERLPELIAFASITACLFFVIYYYFHVQHRVEILENFRSVYLVLFLISVGACILVGRHNLIQFHKLFSPHLYYLTPSPSCCTQAVLYPRHSIQPVIEHLRATTCNKTFSIDHALDNYIAEPGRHAYLVQPSVFNHVGMYSAHKRNKINALLLV